MKSSKSPSFTACENCSAMLERVALLPCTWKKREDRKSTSTRNWETTRSPCADPAAGGGSNPTPADYGGGFEEGSVPSVASAQFTPAAVTMDTQASKRLARHSGAGAGGGGAAGAGGRKRCGWCERFK